MTVWNPYTPGYFNHPYTHLAACRNENPVQKGIHGEWLLFRHADVREVLRSPRFEASNLSAYLASKEPLILNGQGCPFLAKGTAQWLMYLNGAAHTRISTLADTALRRFEFTPVIEAAVAACTAKYIKADELDLAELATEIPMLVAEAFTGITGLFEYEKLKRFSHLLAVSQDLFVSKYTYREINDEFAWAFDFFSKYMRKAVQQPNGQAISILNRLNRETAQPLTEDEMISLICILFMASVETTKDTMTVAFYEIMKNPALMNYAIEAGEKELNILAEELLRIAAPLQYTVRVCKDDYEWYGHVFPKATKLYLCLASANRDETVFENPDALVPGRNPNPHLSFGAGMHACLGARIARMELRTWLKPLCKFLSGWQLSPAAPPVWQKTIFMRGLKSLPAQRK